VQVEQAAALAEVGAEVARKVGEAGQQAHLARTATAHALPLLQESRSSAGQAHTDREAVETAVGAVLAAVAAEELARGAGADARGEGAGCEVVARLALAAAGGAAGETEGGARKAQQAAVGRLAPEIAQRTAHHAAAAEVVVRGSAALAGT
jgi:hypothetical protein